MTFFFFYNNDVLSDVSLLLIILTVAERVEMQTRIEGTLNPRVTS